MIFPLIILLVNIRDLGAFLRLRVSPLSTFCDALNAMQTSSYIFTTVQSGSEKVLKGEFKKNYPNLLSSFQRPGLVTWKSAEGAALQSNIEISSIFTRSYGLSLGE